MNVREECLRKAVDCVCQSRDEQYGSPENSFNHIASLWTAYLGKGISPIDVCMMMSLLKIVRIKNNIGHSDSFVDLAGYAACAMECANDLMLDEEF